MLEHFRDIWLQVKDEYLGGFVVSEKTLQALLYHLLRTKILDVNVIAEPTWKLGDGKKTKRPDLVIVKNELITDIFELKFMQTYSKREWRDVKKLIGYVETNNNGYPVSLCPSTGEWAESMDICANCRLHFVIVAECIAREVNTQKLQSYLGKKFPNHANNFYHWTGRNDDELWEIVPINHE